MFTDQPLLCTQPKLVPESSIKPFSFFAQGIIHTGMSFDRHLYVLHSSFRQHKRAHAFVLASTLAHQGVTAVVTVSSQALFYKVWLDLRHVSCLDSTDSVQGVSSDSNPTVEEISYKLAG